ncbi:MAG: hypothetical protein AAFN51_10115 [Pseudomonadota bacterium]
MHNPADTPITLADDTLDVCTGGARPLSRLKKMIIKQRLDDAETESALNTLQAETSEPS